MSFFFENTPEVESAPEVKFEPAYMDGEKREETSEQYEELNPIGESLMKNIRRDV
jgi:hypothetical protein